MDTLVRGELRPGPQKGINRLTRCAPRASADARFLRLKEKPMTPIELKKLRSTKREPQHYIAYMPPFRAEGNAVLDRNGYFVAQYWDTVIFMANGKAYNIAEVVAEGVNRLVESEEPSF